MKILDVDEFNKIVGKSLEECREEISDSFYQGAKLMIDKVNEMAEELSKSMKIFKQNQKI